MPNYFDLYIKNSNIKYALSIIKYDYLKMEPKPSQKDLNELKQCFRVKFRLLRDKVVKEERYAKDLTNNFLKFITLPQNSIISSYIPINSEIDVLPLTKKLLQIGHIVTVPITDEKNDILIFKKCNFDENSIKIHNEVLEPSILIIPMLAFDKNLMRLGYGKGWYDKTIANMKNRKNKLLIGVAYNLQFSSILLPRDDFDQILDIIITESDVYKAL